MEATLPMFEALNMGTMAAPSADMMTIVTIRPIRMLPRIDRGLIMRPRGVLVKKTYPRRRSSSVIRGNQDQAEGEIEHQKRRPHNGRKENTHRPSGRRMTADETGQSRSLAVIPGDELLSRIAFG